MSLRNKKTEIRRLIKAFEQEADKFHDIKFSTCLIVSEAVVENRKFESPNHTIMLWQFYGNITSKGGPEGFVESLKKSDFQWGVRGSELSSFAIIEGETCNLFARMAKRAGNLFNEKEAMVIKSRVTNEVIQGKAEGKLTPVAILNKNKMAIWLNYLLYYISMTYPGGENARRIEPDPFTLSLLALEQLMESPQIGKVDKSASKVEDIKFKVALSFPGEKRGYVSTVVEVLRDKIGDDKIFYDYDYQSQLARPNLDTMLQNIYRNNSNLIVVFLCEEYVNKQWCGLEWRAIREIIKSKEDNKVMFIRFDNAHVDGVLSIDGYIDANHFSENEIAQFIVERTALLDG